MFKFVLHSFGSSKLSQHGFTICLNGAHVTGGVSDGEEVTMLQQSLTSQQIAAVVASHRITVQICSPSQAENNQTKRHTIIQLCSSWLFLSAHCKATTQEMDFRI